MIMSTKHSEVHSMTHSAIAATADRSAPISDHARRPLLACRWERYQEDSLIGQSMAERSIDPSWESDAPQENTSQHAQQTRLKPVIAEWIETSALLVISALMTLVCDSLLFPRL